MPKKVTMSMIAESCGTSIGTVDRALNNRSDINPETKQLILETAARLGYRRADSAGQGKLRANKRIAAVFPAEPEDFYSCISMGIDRALQELSPLGLSVDKFNYNVHDPGSLNQILEGPGMEKYDAVAMTPQSISASALIDNFSARGKPVALFDNDIENSSRLFYLGGNSFQSGQMGAVTMGLLTGGAGTVTVLGNFTHIMPFLERFDGFCQTMYQEYPEVNICTSPDCRHDYEVTERNIISFLENSREPKGIFCTSYTCTLDAARVLKKLGRQDIRLVGYDVSNQLARAIKEGFCDAVLYQDPFLQGYQTVNLLYKHLCEGWKPEESAYYIETRIVFKQNIDNYADGVMRWNMSL